MGDTRDMRRRDAGDGPSGASPTLALRGLEVLLVDDEPLIRFTIRGYLDGWGCRVHEAANAQQAFESLRTRETIRLMISDVVLDDETLGPQIAAQARELGADGLRALYVSAHPRWLLLQRGWVDARDSVLEKPFTREQLERAVRDALRD